MLLYVLIDEVSLSFLISSRTSVNEFIYTVDSTIIIVKFIVCLYGKFMIKIQYQSDSHGIGKNLVIIYMSLSHYPHCFDVAVRICKYEWLNVVAFNTIGRQFLGQQLPPYVTAYCCSASGL